MPILVRPPVRARRSFGQGKEHVVQQEKNKRKSAEGTERQKCTRAQVIRHKGEIKDKKEHKVKVKRVLSLVGKNIITVLLLQDG